MLVFIYLVISAFSSSASAFEEHILQESHLLPPTDGDVASAVLSTTKELPTTLQNQPIATHSTSTKNADIPPTPPLPLLNSDASNTNEKEQEKEQETKESTINSKNVVENLKTTKDTVEKRKTDISNLKQRVSRIIDQEKETTTTLTPSLLLNISESETSTIPSISSNTIQGDLAGPPTTTESGSESVALPQPLDDSKSNDILQDYRSFEDQKDESKDTKDPLISAVADNTTITITSSTTTTTTKPIEKDAIDAIDAIDQWENNTLAKIEAFAHGNAKKSGSESDTNIASHSKDDPNTKNDLHNKNQPNNSKEPKKNSNSEQKPGGLLSKIGNWFASDTNDKNKNKETMDSELTKEMDSTKQTEGIIQDLKDSIKNQASKQRKERAKDKERLETLQEVVQELTDMEQSMNRTETQLDQAVSASIVQQQKVEIMEKEKEESIAADILEQNIEDLVEKATRIDYESGQVVNSDKNIQEKEKEGQEKIQENKEKENKNELLETKKSDSSAGEIEVKEKQDAEKIDSSKKSSEKSFVKKIWKEIEGTFASNTIPKDQDNHNDLKKKPKDDIHVARGIDGEKEDDLDQVQEQKKNAAESIPQHKIEKENESKNTMHKNVPATDVELKTTVSTKEEIKKTETKPKGTVVPNNIILIKKEKSAQSELSKAEQKALEILSNSDNNVNDEPPPNKKNNNPINHPNQMSMDKKGSNAIPLDNSKHTKTTQPKKKKKLTTVQKRVKKALENARKARRDRDPALIESESGLIEDLSVLLVASAIGGILSRRFNLPTPLGFIAGGMMCGPSGMNWIKDIRQMQTLASLGSVFMLFALGVSFPINEVLRLRNIVITSTFVGQFLIIVVLSQILQMSTFAHSLTSALVVSGGMALSSTSIVLTHINSMRNDSRNDSNSKNTLSSISLKPHGLQRVASIGLYGNIVLGMVACNEFTSAFFLSIPEVLSNAFSKSTSTPQDQNGHSGHTGHTGHTGHSGGNGENGYRFIFLMIVGFSIFLTLIGFGPFLSLGKGVSNCVKWIMKKTNVGYFLESAGRGSMSSRQLLVLTMVAFCLGCSAISTWIGLSGEMGAFVGGLLVSLANRSTRSSKISKIKRRASNVSNINSNTTTSNTGTTDANMLSLEEGTPSKPSYYFPLSPTMDGTNGHGTNGHGTNGHGTNGTNGSAAAASSSTAVVQSVVNPLRNFFSFLYYATVGMALNPGFMFNNLHIIVGMTVGVTIVKTFFFALALGATGAPLLSAATSGLVMSSVGEISLLYINKAHVMNEQIVTRRMMLLYMSSTVFSLTFTPLMLRLLVPTKTIIEQEALVGGDRYKKTVKKLIEIELRSNGNSGSGSGGGGGGGVLERRRKERMSDPEEECEVPV